MRVLVLGGAGNFGARIVRALKEEAGIDLISAGRRAQVVMGSEQVATVALDLEANDLPAQLAALRPGLVIHCVGPFQGQDYRVARASIAAGAHYLDLADGRAFVEGFGPALDTAARDAGVAALSGVSTLPALSSAVVDELRQGMTSLISIESVIAPGQRAPRGAATLAAVFGYLGRPFPAWQGGRWRMAWGWMGLENVTLLVGRRLSAWCDVPDLALFPSRYPGVQTIQFKAALEFRAQHFGLWALAALRRAGLAIPIARWAALLDRTAGLWDRFAGQLGGMRVRVSGLTVTGDRVARAWQVVADAEKGPEIPCMATILLARKIVRGHAPAIGARPCLGELRLEEFAPEFERWGMRTQVEDTP